MKRIMIMFVILLCLMGCTKTRFDGNKIKNSNLYVLDYKKFNDTIEESWYLEAGTILDSNITTNRGSVNIYIVNTDTNEYIYEGNEKGEVTPFSITIRETGTYNFKITGNKSKGKISFMIRGTDK